MGPIASQITSLSIVYSTVYSSADQRKQQSSASLAFVWGIHRGPVNSPHKWPVTRKMFPFDDVIMSNLVRYVDLPYLYLYQLYMYTFAKTYATSSETFGTGSRISGIYHDINVFWNRPCLGLMIYMCFWLFHIFILWSISTCLKSFVISGWLS